MTDQSTRYHHGQLPETLIRLALQHIESEGTEKLSLRALAREAGVSPTAPYSHFPTKTCLLAAIATQGFRQLREALNEASLLDLPIYDLNIQLGMAYVNFARQNATAYKIMFGSVISDFSAYEDLQEAADASHQVVNQVLIQLREEENIEVDLDMLNGAIWALVHGVASLLIDHSDKDYSSSSVAGSLTALEQRTEETLRLLTASLLTQHTIDSR